MTAKGLKSRGQFKEVYEKGKRVAGKKITIIYLLRESGGILPGFVASKKNVGKACQRNRAKRLMREIFRKTESRIREKNIWIVFIASFSPSETAFQELTEDVEGSLARAGLISSCG